MGPAAARSGPAASKLLSCRIDGSAPVVGARLHSAAARPHHRSSHRGPEPGEVTHLVSREMAPLWGRWTGSGRIWARVTGREPRRKTNHPMVGKCGGRDVLVRRSGRGGWPRRG